MTVVAPILRGDRGDRGDVWTEIRTIQRELREVERKAEQHGQHMETLPQKVRDVLIDRFTELEHRVVEIEQKYARVVETFRIGDMSPRERGALGEVVRWWVSQGDGDFAKRFNDFEERVIQIEKVQSAFNVDAMSPRERAVLPDMARSWITHGEKDARDDVRAQTRSRALATYATLMSAVFAGLAIIASYLIATHVTQTTQSAPVPTPAASSTFNPSDHDTHEPMR